MRKDLLKNRLLVSLSIAIRVVLLLTPEVAQAGPCSADIRNFEKAIRETRQITLNASVEPEPCCGPARLASELLQSQLSAAIARANRLDRQDDRIGCRGALNAARRTYIAMH
jgi:hypothetical protein